jgi:hypothetical protein
MSNSKKCVICDDHFTLNPSVMFQDEDGEVTFYCSSCYDENYYEIINGDCDE